ncbi:glycosyltransferase [Ornithinimicrobium sp. INDO-MA30-4]|nr:glycosyltransferase [Ornithinimicrobium sp. INDO-MA30-4]
MRRRDPETVLTVLGTAEGLRPGLSRPAAIRSTCCPRRRFRVDPMAQPLSSRPQCLGPSAAATAMREAKADVVVGFGGYVATPAYLAARRLGLPIVIHEQNARPGLANKLGARFTPHRHDVCQHTFAGG